MSDRRGSTGARLAVAALAVPGLVLIGAGASAAAGEQFTNDTLPGKVNLNENQSATVKLTTPDGFNCSNWIVRKVGQKRASVDVMPPASFAGCTNATELTFTVAVPEGYTKKANVVVKFKVTNTDGTAKAVETLVVKVNSGAAPQTGKPTANPTKPAKPGKGDPQ